MSKVEVKHISKIYGEGATKVVALDDVNLIFNSGEFSALVGPSGSGKTTLLNIIGGLDSPTSGEIDIEGQNLTKMSKKALANLRRDRIGFVFQAYNLVPVMTALENTEFVLQLQDVESEERRARSLQILKEVGLEGKENYRPDQLSGGQQQRVAIARAVVAKPAIVLADEPTANLDSKNAEALMDMMMKLNQETRTTFLFSTHDERVIRRAKRKITLVDGAVFSDEQTNV